jgi:hypothetical protein
MTWHRTFVVLNAEIGKRLTIYPKTIASPGLQTVWGRTAPLGNDLARLLVHCNFFLK